MILDMMDVQSVYQAVLEMMFFMMVLGGSPLVLSVMIGNLFRDDQKIVQNMIK